MLFRASVLCAVLVSSAVLIGRAERTEPVPMREAFESFPLTLDEWRGRRERLDDRTLAVLGADDYLLGVYSAPAKIAGLYVSYWRSQRQGDSIHSPLNCLPGAGWEPTSKSTIQIDAPVARGGGATRTFDANRYIVEKGAERQLVVYWYQSHQRIVASEYTSKFFLVADAIRLNRSDAALVRVSVPILDADDGTRAEQDARAFVHSVFPVLAG